jgi:hypothetical protein
MSDGKMKLGGAKLNDTNQAAPQVPLSKGKVQNVISRPAGFPAKAGIEKIGSMSSSPLKMKGMKGND